MMKSGTAFIALLLVTSVNTLTGAAKAAEAFMHTGGRTTQPVGHYEFCQHDPIECRETTPKQPPVTLTRKLWAAMVDINNKVNTAVTPETDMQIWGKEEVWSYPVNGVGDCEDYVLEKRHELMALGVPAGNLLITVVRQRNGDGHAVLTVHTRNPPAYATGWNVYIGLTPDSIYQQNESPLALGQPWLQEDAVATCGSEPHEGQSADFRRGITRILQRG